MRWKMQIFLQTSSSSPLWQEKGERENEENDEIFRVFICRKQNLCNEIKTRYLMNDKLYSRTFPSLYISHSYSVFLFMIIIIFSWENFEFFCAISQNVIRKVNNHILRVCWICRFSSIPNNTNQHHVYVNVKIVLLWEMKKKISFFFFYFLLMLQNTYANSTQKILKEKYEEWKKNLFSSLDIDFIQCSMMWHFQKKSFFFFLFMYVFACLAHLSLESIDFMNTFF